MSHVCFVCKDTRKMTIGDPDYGNDREVMCTHCPVPCQKCRANGNGAYCTTALCACDCHNKHLNQQSVRAVIRAELLIELAVELETKAQRKRDRQYQTRSYKTIAEEEVLDVLAKDYRQQAEKELE